jgi:hypothetical protein
MSGEETLTMFARLRGIYEEDLAIVVEAAVKAVGIAACSQCQIKTYRPVLFCLLVAIFFICC